MSNYERMVNRQRKWVLYIIAVILIVTIIIPDKHFFLGLLIGAVVSFYNLWLLQRKTNQFGETVVKQGKQTGLGMISRLASAALGTLVVIHYDLSIIGFIIGLVIIYPIIMIDFLINNKK